MSDDSSLTKTSSGRTNEDELARSIGDFARAELSSVAARSGPITTIPPALAEALDALGLFALALPEASGGAGMNRVEQTIVLSALAEIDASVAVWVGLHAAATRLLQAAPSAGAIEGRAAGAQAVVLVARDRRETTVPCVIADDHLLFLQADGHEVRIASDPAATARARAEGSAGATPTKTTEGRAGATPTHEDASNSAEGGLWGLGLGRATELVCVRGSLVPLSPAQAAAEPRLTLAAAAVGVARGAYAAGRAYAAERVQFQTPIARFPAIRAKLVEAELAITSAGALLRAAAERLDAGDPRAIAGTLAACVEMAEAVAHDALQIHGGYGYTRDYPVERAFRDACQLRAWAEAWRGFDHDYRISAAAPRPTRGSRRGSAPRRPAASRGHRRRRR